MNAPTPTGWRRVAVSAPSDDAAALAAALLQAYAARSGREPLPWDAGPMVLADLCGLSPARLAELCQRWLAGYPELSGQFSLYGGASGLVLGLRVAGRVGGRPGYYQRIRDSLIDLAANVPWSQPARDWNDYDLVTGPAGMVLTLCDDPEVGSEALWPVVRHLSRLLATPDLDGLRVTGCRHDPQRRWNTNRVNLGVAHGLPGVIAALVAWIGRFPAARHRDEVMAAVDHAVTWLVTQAHCDPRGIITWAPAASDDGSFPEAASPREAWCYGAPTTAWILREASLCLGRTEVATFAEEVFDRFAEAFDADFHLEPDPRENLAICHGAAGIMLIADAFARHARSRSGEALRRRLGAMIRAGLCDIGAIMAENPTLLSGGCGVLAALLTIEGGSRQWLSALALR